MYSAKNALKLVKNHRSLKSLYSNQVLSSSSIYGLNTIDSRNIHLSKRNNVGEPLIIGAGIAAVAYGGKLLFESIAVSKEKAEQRSESDGETPEEEPGVFSSIFKARFYEGGFEEKMTRKEAALILGVRESSDKKRIVNAHRKLAILNHPDSGGSTFLSAKINEAKEKMLGG